ncbi:MAG: recombinase family protein [Bacteroidota bacterium]
MKGNDELKYFRQFAKGSDNGRTAKGNRAVIYTRVSTKEQADNNMSLETQLKACQKYALHNRLEVVEEFGGTHESEKSDQDRKEFQRMLGYVKQKKHRVDYILVYSYDRFSRTGLEAART